VSDKLIVLILFFLIIPLHAQKHRMGLIYKDPRTVPWMNRARIKLIRSCPDSVDHSEGMPPVGVQRLGSCTAWATGYYYKAYQEFVDHNGWDPTDSDHQFSPKFIYNQINGGIDGGSYILDAMKCLTDLGVAPMSSVSYSDNDYISWPLEKAYSDAIAFRSDSAFYLDITTSQGIEELKQHIANDNDNAVIGIEVWDPFYKGNFGDDNIYDTGDTLGSIVGGHAVCIVGYNDSLLTPDGRGAFRLINSWGSYWGDNGYFWMTYKAVKDSKLCQGNAYYTTDRNNYKPTAKVSYEITHPERLDVTVRVGIGNPASPDWLSDARFNWYMSSREEHPYPDHPIILDITGGLQYLDPYSKGVNVFLKANDKEHNSKTGSVDFFGAMDEERGMFSPSNETPRQMGDGYSIYVNLTFPNQISHWQTFQRLPTNTGFTGLKGGMGPSFAIRHFSTNDSIESSPVIGDIDSDDSLEIIFGSDNDSLYAINADGTKLWSFGTSGDIKKAPAIGDLDGDGNNEIVVGSSDSTIYCLNGEDGSLEWSSFMGVDLVGNPVIGNADGDGLLEVVMGTREIFLHCLNGEDGQDSWFAFIGKTISSSPVIGDVDGDGLLEVIVGTEDGSVIVKKQDGYSDGSFSIGYPIIGSPTVGDIDNDSINEIIVSSSDTLYALKMGSILWKFGTSGDIQSSPALGDLDGDSNNEVVFGSSNSTIYCLNGEDCSLKWSYPTGGPVISSPAIADIDNDDTFDVVVGSTDGYLYGISGDGSLLWRINLGTSITSSPAIGDIDNDGYLEIAVGGLDGNLYLIEGLPSGIVEGRKVEPLSLSKLLKPINGNTEIQYSIPERTLVKLAIFDIMGREIKMIVNRLQNAGRYQVPVDINGIANGIYFYRLTAGEKTLTNKMVVIR